MVHESNNLAVFHYEDARKIASRMNEDAVAKINGILEVVNMKIYNWKRRARGKDILKCLIDIEKIRRAALEIIDKVINCVSEEINKTAEVVDRIMNRTDEFLLKLDNINIRAAQCTGKNIFEFQICLKTVLLDAQRLQREEVYVVVKDIRDLIELLIQEKATITKCSVIELLPKFIRLVAEILRAIEICIGDCHHGTKPPTSMTHHPSTKSSTMRQTKPSEPTEGSPTPSEPSEGSPTPSGPTEGSPTPSESTPSNETTTSSVAPTNSASSSSSSTVTPSGTTESSSSSSNTGNPPTPSGPPDDCDDGDDDDDGDSNEDDCDESSEEDGCY
nr:uncharacterized protein LOC117224962 [Megalopta genalis]